MGDAGRSRPRRARPAADRRGGRRGGRPLPVDRPVPFARRAPAARAVPSSPRARPDPTTPGRWPPPWPGSPTATSARSSWPGASRRGSPTLSQPPPWCGACTTRSPRAPSSPSPPSPPAAVPLMTKGVMGVSWARHPSCWWSGGERWSPATRWPGRSAWTIGSSPTPPTRRTGTPGPSPVSWPRPRSGSNTSWWWRRSLRALDPRCGDLSVPAEPSLVRLHTVAHLGTSYQGTLLDDRTAACPASLELLADAPPDPGRGRRARGTPPWPASPSWRPCPGASGRDRSAGSTRPATATG